MNNSFCFSQLRSYNSDFFQDIRNSNGQTQSNKIYLDPTSQIPNYQWMQKWTFIWNKKINTNIFRSDKFLKPVVVVNHTGTNYFDRALSDWAIKVEVYKVTFVPPCTDIVFNDGLHSKYVCKYVQPLTVLIAYSV